MIQHNGRFIEREEFLKMRYCLFLPCDGEERMGAWIRLCGLRTSIHTEPGGWTGPLRTSNLKELAGLMRERTTRRTKGTRQQFKATRGAARAALDDGKSTDKMCGRPIIERPGGGKSERLNRLIRKTDHSGKGAVGNDKVKFNENVAKFR